MISIVIPTYNEAENIERLIPQIFLLLKDSGIEGEVIVVDDNSPDGTAAIARDLSRKYPVRVLQRPAKLGLSSAVLDGFRHARGDILGVMDADLSHDVTKLPHMVYSLKDYDLVIGSRYVSGGGTRDWSKKRRLISKGATWLARPLTKVKDPMSGFFVLKRSVIEGVELSPRGYKIGLEILTKGRDARIKEIPYIFRDRKNGQSKMNRKEVLNYIFHLGKLYRHRIRR